MSRGNPKWVLYILVISRNSDYCKLKVVDKFTIFFLQGTCKQLGKNQTIQTIQTFAQSPHGSGNDLETVKVCEFASSSQVECYITANNSAGYSPDTNTTTDYTKDECELILYQLVIEPAVSDQDGCGWQCIPHLHIPTIHIQLLK